MSDKSLKILQVVSEIYPYSKTGGLGHVTADITYNMANTGHEVTVITPLFGSVWKTIKKKNVETVLVDIPIEIDSTTTITCSCIKYVRFNGTRKPITFYFINHYDFFGRYSRNLYSSPEMHKRMYFFSRAAAVIIKELKLDFDIAHIHDWMVGLFPQAYKENFKLKGNKMPKMVLTIHNLGYQGSSFLNENRFNKRLQRPPLTSFPPFTNDEKWNRVNFLKQGIKNVDMITTVSTTYVEEILTPGFGEGLSSFLNKFKPIYGITNGIDYKEYNPLTSTKIFDNYNTVNVSTGKRKNKEKLAKILKIPKNLLKYPFLITTHRLSYQKGFDLILQVFNKLMKGNVVFIVLGDGDQRYIDKFHELDKKYKNFKFITPFSEATNERMLAASDIILSPSIYEPCGTAHMKGMRYGVVPVARKVGGLADTISNYDVKKNSGTGFVFLENDKTEFINTIKKALKLYENKVLWKQLQKRCMTQSFSWETSIEEYIYLYKKLLKSKPKKKK